MNRASLALLCLGTALVGLVSVGLGSREQARTWVVDDSGYDCPDADFTDIQPAVDAASPGDTVMVCPGVYSPVVVRTDGLTIVSLEDRERRGMHTIVHAEGRKVNAFTVEADHVTVKGIWVTSAGGDGRRFGHGFHVSGSRVTIAWCTTTLNSGDGVRVSGGSGHRVEHCTVSYNGHGIRVAEGVGRIEGVENRLVECDLNRSEAGEAIVEPVSDSSADDVGG